jgi:hypothetical protein
MKDTGMSTIERLVTLDEFRVMPDPDERCELVRGAPECPFVARRHDRPAPVARLFRGL